MPSIQSTGPAASWTSSRANYQGAEYGHSQIAGFGRALDGDLSLTTTFTPTSQRAGGASHSAGVVTPLAPSAISVTGTVGTVVAGQYVACAGVTDGTTVSSYVAGQTTTCSTVNGSSTVTLASTSGLSVGQYCNIANIGYCLIGQVVNSTQIITSATQGLGFTASASATASGVSFVAFAVINLSSPAAQTWNGQTLLASVTTSSLPLKGRSVDAPTVAVNSIDATNTILSVSTVGAAGSNYDFLAGDYCILLNMQGGAGASSTVGNWELCRVASIAGASGPTNPLNITLVDPLARVYGATANSSLTGQKVMLLRLPEYGTLTIGNGGIVTADAWNGQTGGVLALMAQQVTCSGTGKLVGDGLGYRGFNAAGAMGEGNTGGYGSVGVTATGSGGGGGASPVPATPMNGGVGGFAPAVSPSPGLSRSGGSGGGAGGSGGGAGGGGGYGATGGNGAMPSSGGTGAAGGAANPVGPGPAGGNPTPFGTGPSPASDVPYGASGRGALYQASSPQSNGGSAVGTATLSQLYMGGAGGTCGSGGAGGSGGAPWPAPPTVPAPSAPSYAGSAGFAGGSGGGWTSPSKGGNGGGIIMVFARSVTSLAATCYGTVGSIGSAGTAPTLSSSVSTFYQQLGGAGGGGAGGGGCGNGACGTIYIYAQNITTTNGLDVSPASASPGGAAGMGGNTTPVPTAPNVNFAGTGGTGGIGGRGAAGRIKVVYASMDGVSAASTADGANLFPNAPGTNGYKQTL